MRFSARVIKTKNRVVVNWASMSGESELKHSGVRRSVRMMLPMQPADGLFVTQVFHSFSPPDFRITAANLSQSRPMCVQEGESIDRGLN